MTMYSILSGGGKNDVSEFFTSDKILQFFMVMLLVFLVKAYIVYWSYNNIWPTLVRNSGASVEDFRPLTYVEAMILTLLAMALFNL